MLNDKMQKALNKQMNAEFYNSYLYLSMSAYFESLSLPGFAHWLYVQSQEETMHAMKIYRFLFDALGRAELDTLKKPPVEWESPLDAFEDAYKAECQNSKQINDLVMLAEKEQDYASESMLQWFITEQVEEEQITDEVVQKLKLVGKNTRGLYMLDKEMATRAAATPPVM